MKHLVSEKERGEIASRSPLEVPGRLPDEGTLQNPFYLLGQRAKREQTPKGVLKLREHLNYG